MSSTGTDKERDQLRSSVVTWGLSLYLLLPVLLLWSLLSYRKTGRISTPFVGCVSVVALAGALLMYRNYFGSLGW